MDKSYSISDQNGQNLHPVLDQNNQNLYPISDQMGSKTIPKEVSPRGFVPYAPLRGSEKSYCLFNAFLY